MIYCFFSHFLLTDKENSDTVSAIFGIKSLASQLGCKAEYDQKVEKIS